MTNSPRYVTVGDYLKVVRSQRWIIILTTLLFAAAAYAWSERQEKVYHAESSLIYRDPLADASLVGGGTSVTATPEERAAVGARTATTLPVAIRAKRYLRTKDPAGSLLGSISANAEVRSNLVVIGANRSNPEEAARFANAFAAAVRDRETADVRQRFRQAARTTKQTLSGLGNSGVDALTRAGERQQIARLQQLAALARPVQIATRASAPANPVRPRPVRNTIIAAVVGLALGLLVAFLRTSLDRRVRQARDVVDATSYPLLGTIRDEALGRSPLPNGKGRGRSLEEVDLEAFRIVRTNVEFLDPDQRLSTIVVSSPLPEEGKSTVASSLATASALVGRRTLLLECDLRAPVLWKRFGINAGPGITDFLAGNVAPPEILQTVTLPSSQSPNGGPNSDLAAPVLVCITAGSPVAQPAELLSSSRFAQFIEQVSSAYDTVILDTSPLLPVVDTLELVQYADAVVLCARAHQSTRDELKAAKEALDRLPQRPTGIVVTGVRAGEGIAYGYYADDTRYTAKRA
jgi:capsular exopolysaccharide synthesis family protein